MRNSERLNKTQLQRQTVQALFLFNIFGAPHFSLTASRGSSSTLESAIVANLVNVPCQGHGVSLRQVGSSPSYRTSFLFYIHLTTALRVLPSCCTRNAVMRSLFANSSHASSLLASVLARRPIAEISSDRSVRGVMRGLRSRKQVYWFQKHSKQDSNKEY